MEIVKTSVCEVKFSEASVCEDEGLFTCHCLSVNYVSFTDFPTVTVLANAFITEWNYNGRDAGTVFPCYTLLSELCSLGLQAVCILPSCMFLSSCNNPNRIFIAMVLLEEVSKGFFMNVFLYWYFLCLSLNQWMHAANRCINASCTEVFWRSHLNPEDELQSSSLQTGWNFLNWKHRNSLLHEIMFPNTFSLLSEQFSLSDQVTAESCCFSFFICIS